ncbi:MAG: amidase domain-containing protein [Lachnospiraceae bacterium]
MKMKKWVSSILVLIMVLGIGTVSTASDKATVETVNPIIKQEAVELLEKGYGEYYDLYDSTATLCCTHEDNNLVETYFLLEIEATLKAKSVWELDFYQGMMEFYNSNVATEVGNQKNTLKYMNSPAFILEETEDMYDYLNQYIGKKQVFPFYVKATYNKNDLENAIILYEDGLEYVAAECLYPQSSEELKRNGYSYLKREYEQNISSLMKEESMENNAKAANRSYSVLNAVGYSESHTSNPTTCSIHGTTCGYFVNTNKYNANYTNYAGTHSDCANFVSQIVKAGGIPTDNIWKAGATQWVNVVSLCNYMVSNGYWEAISYSELAVGDIIRFSDHHIGFVSANDGQKFRYSAHTNDRQNYAFSNNSSYTYYRVIY